AAAGRMAEALRKDEAGRLARAITLRLSPVSAAAAYETYWALKLEGKEAEGRDVLRACAARRVPMPGEIKWAPAQAAVSTFLCCAWCFQRRCSRGPGRREPGRQKPSSARRRTRPP